VATNSSVIGGIAGRYAAALYELANEGKALDPVAADLSALKALIGESADLVRLLRSPLIDRGDKAAAMNRVLLQAGANDLTRRFIGVVAGNNRLFALPGMIDAFLAELARRRGEVTAEVASARPLGERQLAAITETLRAALGGRVAVEPRVDPSLIGGLVVRVGSRMIDASLKSKLQRLQVAMKGAQ
jgi:F-type H+-transporting ATPase subunit delta